MSNNQPVVFNVRYTPYMPSPSWNEKKQQEHTSDRAFYDMSGETNIFSYITTEKKLKGDYNVLDYLEKNTGVFNDNGCLTSEQIKEMKQRAKDNKGNIWHGFISLNQEESKKIDTLEKCIELVKRTFGDFLKDARFNPKNIDLMCALHQDRPKHLHIHFVFWEKGPTFINHSTNELEYRRKGRIESDAIEKVFVRLGLYLDDEKNRLYKSRDKSLAELRGMTAFKVVINSSEEIKDEIVKLAKDLPKTGRLTYGSEDMKPYRGRVDKIVQLLLDNDKVARNVDNQFYKALEDRRRAIKNICGKDYVYSDKDVTAEEMEKNMPKYHFKIDETKIHLIEDIEADYKRRQGNLVINIAKFIKPEIFERDKNKKYKVNDIGLKRQLDMSRKKVNRAFGKFLLSFGRESSLLERDFSNRLQQIELEMKEEKDEQKQKLKKEDEHK